MLNTSSIARFFAGTYLSEVECMTCHNASRTQQQFLDLNLEIQEKQSFYECLKSFFQEEILDGNNLYKCPNCNKLSRAVKRTAIEHAPLNLIIQFKRFTNYGIKIKKDIAYPLHFDLNDFLYKQQGKPSLQFELKYELYGVLIHDGHFAYRGHYYCFLKGRD